MSNNNLGNHPCYYYTTSRTPITNFSSTFFVDCGNSLPNDVKQKLAECEKKEITEPIKENEEPKDIQITEEDFVKEDILTDVPISVPGNEDEAPSSTTESAGQAAPTPSSTSEAAPSTSGEASSSSSDGGSSLSSSDGGGGRRRGRIKDIKKPA